MFGAFRNFFGAGNAVAGPIFVIEGIEDKGLGMRANRDINRGELILLEQPIIELPIGPASLFNPKTFYDANKRYSGSKVLEAIFCRITEDQQQKLLALKRHTQNRLGFVQANAFTREYDQDGVEHCTIYVCNEISRVNHSCRPNAAVNPNNINGDITLWAMERIPARTEITIDYMSEVETYLSSGAERRKILRKAYHFYCECGACAKPDGQKQRYSNQQDDQDRQATATYAIRSTPNLLSTASWTSELPTTTGLKLSVA